MTVTIDESGAISDVTVDASNETAGIGVEAAEQLQEAILEAQSADVDIVSGATITSEAVIEAVQDCLSQASAQ